MILDNASVHTGKALQPYLLLLHKQALTLYFLPACSLELNRIEKFCTRSNASDWLSKHASRNTRSGRRPDPAKREQGRI
ncbi:transposase [Burkholderia territorii]|uniref:transposase n=1 Tax=Burkholderia territorii TaxID=1503055 RepID=UPI0018C611B2